MSNAGAAWQGRIGDVSDELLRKSFELNFFAHQTVAQEAVRIMLDVHKNGIGVAGVFSYEVAETKAGKVMRLARAQEFPLRCSVELA